MSAPEDLNDVWAKRRASIIQNMEQTLFRLEYFSAEDNWDEFRRITQTTQHFFDDYDFDIDSNDFGSRFKKALDSFGKHWTELLPWTARFTYRFDTLLAAMGGLLVATAAGAVFTDQYGLAFLTVVGVLVTLIPRARLWPRREARDSDGNPVDYYWWVWAVNMKQRRIPWWWNRTGLLLTLVIFLWLVFSSSRVTG